VDDKTQATFPEFKPQPTPMFEDKVETTAPAITGPGRGRKVRNSQAPAKTKGKPRGQRRTMPATTPTEAPKKATRKPRQVKGIKLDLATALTIASGLKETDVHLLGQIADVLKAQSKRSREAILAALAKLFG
jgi:hypothetical protein